MRKEDQLKRILCYILEEICKTTSKVQINKYEDSDLDFNDIVYTPKFKSTPSFFFIESEIKLIKDLAEQYGKDFSKLTGK